MDIVRVGLQLPEKLPALFECLCDCLGGAPLLIGGGFLRSLYFRQYLGRPAALADIDVFGQAAGLPVKTLAGFFGEPIHERDMRIAGVLHTRLDYSVRSDSVGTSLMQLILSATGRWATRESFLTEVNAFTNGIVYDGEAVWCRQEFLEDCQTRVVRLNLYQLQGLPSGEAYTALKSTQKKVENYLQRPEFEGFRLVGMEEALRRYPIPEPQGAFWQG